LKHDHIVNLIEVFRDNGRIFLVFEQLNRTILEELEGNGENGVGIDPIEVNYSILQII
jgi:cyclin-dependent kinase-like